MDAAGLHYRFRHSRQVGPAARLIVLNEAKRKEVAPSPQELVRLICAVARNQDRQAFAQLFAYFAPRVKSFLMRSGLTDSVAEEVAQEVMITLWRKASYFDPSRAGAATWVLLPATGGSIGYAAWTAVAPMCQWIRARNRKRLRQAKISRSWLSGMSE
jgi:RNA polymerase sigma-70 factor (ECF subfamily)